MGSGINGQFEIPFLSVRHLQTAMQLEMYTFQNTVQLQTGARKEWSSVSTLLIHLKRNSHRSALMFQQKRKRGPRRHFHFLLLMTADTYTVSDKPLKVFTQSESRRCSHARRIKSEAMGAEVLIKATSAADRGPPSSNPRVWHLSRLY